MAAERIRKVITAQGATALEAKNNAIPGLDAAFASFGFNKADGYASRYIWKESPVYIEADLTGTSTSTVFTVSDARGTDKGTNGVIVVTGGGSAYSFELTVEAYTVGNTVALLLYGNNAAAAPFLITTVMIDGTLDYAFAIPYNNSVTLGLRCINTTIRPWCWGVTLTTPQVIKMDGVPITIGNVVRGYLPGLSGIVTDNSATLMTYTTDGHKYLCIRLSSGVSGNVLGLEIE